MSKWSSILTRAKEIGEAGSSFIPIIKFVLSISGVLGVFLITNAHFEQKRIIEQYAYDVQQYEERVQVVNGYADSLKNEVQVQEQESQQSLIKVAQLEQTVQTLSSQKEVLEDRINTLRETVTITDPVVNEIIESQDSIIHFQEDIIVTQEETITELSTIIERKDLSIYFLTQSVDSLQTVIDTRPKLPEDPEKLLGIIPTPSRKTTAVTAFAVGVITTILIVR